MYFLQQSLKASKSLPKELVTELGIHPNEVLTRADVQSINALFNDKFIGAGIKELLIKESCKEEAVLALRTFINNKRVFLAGDNCVFIPRSKFLLGESLDALNMKLVNLAIAWEDFLAATPLVADEKRKMFDSLLRAIRLDITKNILSKDFKNNFQFKFKGYSGVALPGGNLDLDEILIPSNSGIKVGSVCLVSRDPAQHLFISLKVVGYSDGVRVNPYTIMLLDGDFDGDKIQVIPMNNIINEHIRLNPDIREIEIDNFISSLKEEFESIKPTSLSRYFEEKGLPENLETGIETISVLDMIDSSSKSAKYIGESGVSIKDSILETVLNALGVNQGTGSAGSFCNWISETARNAGLDVAEARELANKLQRLALDSKHTTGHGGYKSLTWYRFVQYRTTVKKGVSVEQIIKDLTDIIENNETVVSGTTKSFIGLEDFNF